MRLYPVLHRALVVAAMLSVTASYASAQGRARRQAQSAARRAAEARAVRAEYAELLLQTRRYEEAATEFRRLSAANPANAAYRLGLARALAWGGRPREAEPLLRALARAQPGDTAVRRLLLDVRRAFEPGAAEAAAWLAEEPGNHGYRLALARALVRERRFPAASAQFDTLIARNPTLALLREAAGARAAAGDSVANARILARAVAFAPTNDSLRREYAAALVWAGDRSAAIVQYSELIARNPDDAGLLFERGRLYVWTGDYARGERDLVASNGLRPDAATWALLGDAYRWRGDYHRSRAAYAAALALAPGDPGVMAGIAELERVRSGAVATAERASVGWSSQLTHIEDNAGFLYLAAGIARGFRLDRRTIGGVGVEQRRISVRTAGGPERYVLGYAVDGQASRALGWGDVGARGGIVRHALVRTIPQAALRVSSARGAASGSIELSTGPVYVPLVSIQSLVQFGGEGVASATPLVGRTAQAAGALPLGAGTVYAGADLTALDDGNRRTSGYLSAAYPIARRLSALYSGFGLTYSDRSERYWDPRLYTAHSVGAEYGYRGPGRLSVVARALAGLGRTAESFATADGAAVRGSSHVAPQFSGGGEATWRAATWDLSFNAGYGRGRAGEYQSLNSSLRLRLVR